MRLVIISNRLPITVVEKGNTFSISDSAGGLATGLRDFLLRKEASRELFSDYLLVGWPGVIPKCNKMKDDIRKTLTDMHNSVSVMLTAKDIERYYFGFSNKTLWPLFHYFPQYTIYKEEFWEQYKYVNKLFCDAVVNVAKPDDIFWVHDYQLMLLPSLLREKFPGGKIGFFLHIPFPHFEVYRLLPMKWRVDLLKGLLGADLIGFHTYDYTQYFLKCVYNILGYENDIGEIYTPERLVKADVFPIGIDFDKFNKTSLVLEVRDEIDRYRSIIGDRRTILSVDRLDYTKGILNRILAFDLFLDRNPEWIGKIILFLIVVPSRTGVEQYQEMKKKIDEEVGRINGKFSSINWNPVIYQYKSLPFDNLAALYNVSDIALVTPLRDGMNLVAKEYVAARRDQRGVLILSEMTGAARELGEAVLINPSNPEDISDALSAALLITPREQVKRMRIMQERISSYDVFRWVEDFVSSITGVKEKQEISRSIPISSKERIVREFQVASRRMLFLDYDRALSPYAEFPGEDSPTWDFLPDVSRLSAFPGTEVVIVSGRDKLTLQKMFQDFDIHLVAEHGAIIRERKDGWKPLVHLSQNWKDQILPILVRFSHRLPGSLIEEKEFSVVLHYRKADPALAEIRVRELMNILMHLAANRDLHICDGNKAIEVKNSGISKGMAAQYFLRQYPSDFILAIGDDFTDEELFNSLPQNTCSLKIGIEESCAKYNVYNHDDVSQILGELVNAIDISLTGTTKAGAL